jgi:hypothetical protein
MVFQRFRKETLLCGLLAYWMVHLPMLDAKLEAVVVMVPLNPPEMCEMGGASISGNGSCCAKRAARPPACCICFSLNDLNPLPERDLSLSPRLPLLWVISPLETTRPDHIVQPPIPPPEAAVLS